MIFESLHVNDAIIPRGDKLTADTCVIYHSMTIIGATCVHVTSK